jgi:hypothetical protein
MGKYLIKMNYSVSYSTEFVVEGKDEDEVTDIVENMNSEFLEKTLPWSCSDYSEPVIMVLETTSDSSGKILMNNNPIFLAKYNQIKKEIYE